MVAIAIVNVLVPETTPKPRGRPRVQSQFFVFERVATRREDAGDLTDSHLRIVVSCRPAGASSSLRRRGRNLPWLVGAFIHRVYIATAVVNGNQTPYGATCPVSAAENGRD